MRMRFWNNQDKYYINAFSENEIILREFAFEKSDELAIAVTNLLKNDIDDYFKNNNITMELYTGLKDKNGTRIYVGDIIKRNWNGEESLHTIKFGGFTHYESGEEMIGFYLYEHCKDGSYFTQPISVIEFMPPHNIKLGVYNEVIGNINEHKHLLEKLVKLS